MTSRTATDELVSAQSLEESRAIRLAYFVSHPIQYQAPLLKHLASQPDIDLTVYFSSNFSVREYVDKGFGVPVEWDVPLLDGYRYEFLPRVFGGRGEDAAQVSGGIFRRLRDGRFDAVWVHGYSTVDALHAILAARVLGIPVLLRSDSNLYDRSRSPLKLGLKRFFFSWLRSAASGVLACGKANRDYWEHYLGADFPIFDMPYAVDNRFFRELAQEASRSREELRRELGLQLGRPVVLFASKLQKRKRCLDLVEAFLQLASDMPLDRKPCLLIVGDGEERAEIEHKTTWNPDIQMLGFRNQRELPRYFDLCDVFVLPSVYEPWGLVVNEAMNAGRAVIVSDEVGCQPDLVADGINGCVFKARDAGALAYALRRVLASPENLARMGQESLRIVDDYSFEQDLAGLRQALHSLTGLPKKRAQVATMKVLYLGSEHGTSAHRAAAISRLGHEVTVLDPDSLLPSHRAIARWKRYTSGIGLADVVRRRVLASIQKRDFDLAWIDHGELIGRNLVDALKARIPRVICYNIDDPFGGRDKMLWGQFLKALPSYDLVVVMRTCNVEEAYRHGAKQVMRVFMSADEVAHAPHLLSPPEQQAWGSEVVFVGTAFPERGPFLAELVRLGLPLAIYGERYPLLREWPTAAPALARLNRGELGRLCARNLRREGMPRPAVQGQS